MGLYLAEGYGVVLPAGREGVGDDGGVPVQPAHLAHPQEPRLLPRRRPLQSRLQGGD